LTPITPSVEADAAPTAAFRSHVISRSLSVDAFASFDPDGEIASYAWDFGDGATASGMRAWHEYAVPGDYHVRLTVTDDRGARASSVTTVSASGWRSGAVPGPLFSPGGDGAALRSPATEPG
jgi:PKD repeat protein